MIYLLAILALIGISIEDKKTMAIHDGITLLGTLAVLNIHLFFGDIKLCIIGLTAGIMSIFFMNASGLQKLGGGDMKLMGLLGAIFGWQVAVATTGLAWLIYKACSGRSTARYMAYSPFITVAFILVSIWQNAT